MADCDKISAIDPSLKEDEELFKKDIQKMQAEFESP